ncbi:MAG: glycosyltransferase [Oscillospiraceae bacterium]|nr:glycosyltransferase [Oscillospiraceae bacterium]
MKILQINAVGQTASTGRTCRELAEYINTRTEDRCYTAFSVGTVNEYCYRIGGRTDTKLHGFWSRLTGKQAHFSHLQTAKLLAYIRKLRPDVVHLRNLHSNYIHFPMLMRFLAQQDIPTVVTLHDCWMFTGKCCHYTMDGCYRWQTGCGNCPRLKKDNKSWFIDATAQLWREKKRLFEAIPRLVVTGVSQWTVDEARKSFLTCARDIVRIYNWIDLEVFSPKEITEEARARYVRPGKKMVLGVASGWSEAKGFGGFLELAKRLGEDYQICLVGSIAKETELPENVRHIQRTDSPAELAELYSMADVFVTMSPEETFGKVSAEALACGTPVVCYDSTANKELVGEGCGNVHQLGDLDGVEASVRAICASGKASYLKTCRAFAEANFRKEDRIGDHLELYRSIQQ